MWNLKGKLLSLVGVLFFLMMPLLANTSLHNRRSENIPIVSICNFRIDSTSTAPLLDKLEQSIEVQKQTNKNLVHQQLLFQKEKYYHYKAEQIWLAGLLLTLFPILGMIYPKRKWGKQYNLKTRDPAIYHPKSITKGGWIVLVCFFIFLVGTLIYAGDLYTFYINGHNIELYSIIP
jgi:hypothetical protein